MAQKARVAGAKPDIKFSEPMTLKEAVDSGKWAEMEKLASPQIKSTNANHNTAQSQPQKSTTTATSTSTSAAPQQSQPIAFHLNDYIMICGLQKSEYNNCYGKIIAMPISTDTSGQHQSRYTVSITTQTKETKSLLVKYKNLQLMHRAHCTHAHKSETEAGAPTDASADVSSQPSTHSHTHSASCQHHHQHSTQQDEKTSDGGTASQSQPKVRVLPPKTVLIRAESLPTEQPTASGGQILDVKSILQLFTPVKDFNIRDSKANCERFKWRTQTGSAVYGFSENEIYYFVYDQDWKSSQKQRNEIGSYLLGDDVYGDCVVEPAWTGVKRPEGLFVNALNLVKLVAARKKEWDLAKKSNQK